MRVAFILTTLAGLSTVIGIIPIFFRFSDNNKIIAGSLSFASGVMIAVSIFDLIPESIKIMNEYCSELVLLLCILFVFLGIFFSYFLNSKSISSEFNGSLYHVGVISMIAIIMHNIPEGIITFVTVKNDIRLGIGLVIAIAIHNIPEGISIGVPIYYSTGSKIRAFLYTFIAGISELFGAVIAYLFLLPIINMLVLSFLFSFIAGVMLHISFMVLLPTSYSYGYFKFGILLFLFGFIFFLFYLYFYC